MYYHIPSQLHVGNLLPTTFQNISAHHLAFGQLLDGPAVHTTGSQKATVKSKILAVACSSLHFPLKCSFCHDKDQLVLHHSWFTNARTDQHNAMTPTDNNQLCCQCIWLLSNSQAKCPNRPAVAWSSLAEIVAIAQGPSRQQLRRNSAHAISPGRPKGKASAQSLPRQPCQEPSTSE